jgi:uncharacterized protein (DUF885 family)
VNRKLKSALLSIALGLLVHTAALEPALGQSTGASASQTAADQRLLAFLDQAFDEALEYYPEDLTSLGIKSQYDKLNNYSGNADREALRLAEKKLAEMTREFPANSLSPAGQLSVRLFEDAVERQRIRLKWRSHQFPVTPMFSPAGTIPAFLITQHRVDNVSDARAYISRLREVERVMKEVSVDLQDRERMGIIVPKFTFEPVMADARRVITGAPFDSGADSALLADFRKKVEALKIEPATKTELIGQAQDALTGPFKRGYELLLSTLEALQPKAKGNDGAWSLPNGAAYYTDAVKLQTTSDLTPDQIHDIGLKQTARIHREMEAIKQRVGFNGSLQAFFAHVKTDPQFHYPNTDAGRQAYLADARTHIDSVMANAKTLFRTMPKAKLEVRAVETWRQDTSPTAFYQTSAPDGSRPGIYYVNLADMRQVLKPQVEAIAYHEGAPGHHFQVAISQELTGLPKFRRFSGYNAYSEGWGLYAERLGKEMGYYTDPYSDFGRLSLELWRAARLVTDTGLHAKRWSREQAIEYFKQNTLLSDRDIVREVERYIVVPGQATSYMVGQLEILRLRSKAEAALGNAFDLRDFHEVVLTSGALPLGVLAEQVDSYIAAKSGKTPAEKRASASQLLRDHHVTGSAVVGN